MQTKWDTQQVKEACEMLLESNAGELFERTANAMLTAIKLSEKSDFPHIWLNFGELTTLKEYL